MKTGIRYEIVPYDSTFSTAVRRPAACRLPLKNASVVRPAPQPGNKIDRQQRIAHSYGPGGTVDPLTDVRARGVIVDVYA